MSNAQQTATMIGAVVAVAVGLVALGATGSVASRQLYAPSMVRPAAASAVATMPAHRIGAVNSQSQPIMQTVSVAQVSSVGAQRPAFPSAAQPAKVQPVAWVALASVMGAIAGFFLTKSKRSGFEYEDVENASRRAFMNQAAASAAAVGYGLTGQEALAYTPAGEGVSAANQKKLCGAMPTAKICTRKDVAMFATTGERVEGEEAMDASRRGFMGQVVAAATVAAGVAGTQEALAYTPAGEGVSAANQKKLCGAMPTAKICTRKDVAMFATTGERVEGEEAMDESRRGFMTQAVASATAIAAGVAGTQEALAYTPAGEGVSAANQKKLCGAMPTAKICTRKDVAMFATTGERVEGEEAMGTSRREALTQLVGGVAAASLLGNTEPALAAYGESANVFGKKAEVNQAYTVSGEGWSTMMPAKYNPSKETEYEGQVGRWEDNFDAISNSSVVVKPVNVSSVKDLGPLEDVLNTYVTPFLGVQSFEGSTISEGGFAAGRVSSAAILDIAEADKDGKTYYYYELLSRTADGDEGGKHQLFAMAVSNNKLYILRHQAGDKRWFKGLERPIKASIAEFTVY